MFLPLFCPSSALVHYVTWTSCASRPSGWRADHADAAASLLEGIEEMFTVNRLGLPPTLMRCLTTTNIIENPNGIVRSTTQRVKRWRDQDMTLRWTAAGFHEAEKSFRKVLGSKELWILRAALGRDRTGAAEAMKKAA